SGLLGCARCHIAAARSCGAACVKPMADIRTRLRQTHDDVIPPSDVMGALATRAARMAGKRKEERRKVIAAVIGIAAVAAGIGVFLRELSRPSTNPLVEGNPVPQIPHAAKLAPGPHTVA